MIHIAVSDTGVGIPRESLSDLFAAFQQIHGSIRREHSGTGLGLTLVSQLAELHGGSVSVESEVGEGSRFILSLPIVEARDNPAIEEPRHPTAGSLWVGSDGTVEGKPKYPAHSYHDRLDRGRTPAGHLAWCRQVSRQANQ